MIELTTHAEGIVLPIHAQPGARKNAVLGEHAGALRVAVSAAPEQGKANAAIVEVLATALGCKASRIALLSGQASRDKKFLISGMSREELHGKIEGIVRT